MITPSCAWFLMSSAKNSLMSASSFFAGRRAYLGAKVELDHERLRALAPECSIEATEEQLALIPRMCQGEGPIGQLGLAETYHWLVAPHSTVVQCSPVHSGITDDLPGTLERLMDMMVRKK